MTHNLFRGFGFRASAASARSGIVAPAPLDECHGVRHYQMKSLLAYIAIDTQMQLPTKKFQHAALCLLLAECGGSSESATIATIALVLLIVLTTLPN